MFLVTLAEKGGGTEQIEFEKNEITIGRLAGNDIVLAKGNVSKYHSKIVSKDGKFIVLDMKSTNGTFVNGKKIAAPMVLKPTDKVYIGDYIINVEPLDAPSLPTAGAGEEVPGEQGYDEGGYEGDQTYGEEEQYEEEPPP